MRTLVCRGTWSDFGFSPLYLATALSGRMSFSTTTNISLNVCGSPSARMLSTSALYAPRLVLRLLRLRSLAAAFWFVGLGSAAEEGGTSFFDDTDLLPDGRQ